MDGSRIGVYGFKLGVRIVVVGCAGVRVSRIRGFFFSSSILVFWRRIVYAVCLDTNPNPTSIRFRVSIHVPVYIDYHKGP